MHLQSLGRDALLAGEAVCDAVRFMRTAQRDTVGYTLTKADASPVTAADFIMQAFLAFRVACYFPGDPLVAEEDASALRAATASAVRGRVVELVRQMLPDPAPGPEQVLGWIDRGSGSCGHRFWTLDPIDGTKGLLRGGQYVIALALVIDGSVQIGIVGCPHFSITTGPASPAAPANSPEHAVVASVEDDAEGGVAIAVRDRGAWWMSLRGSSLIRLSVSAEANPTRTRALHSCESRHSDVGQLHRVLRELGSHAPPILMDGQAKHVLLAAGAAELLLRIPVDPDYRETIWDQAAGSLLVQEAGGRVTDVDGQPLDFTTGRRLLRNRGLVASNGLLHDVALDVVRQGSVR